MSLGLGDDPGPGRARRDHRRVAVGIDGDGCQPGRVDQHRTVGRRARSLPARSHRHREMLGAGEAHGMDDVVGALGQDDRGRARPRRGTRSPDVVVGGVAGSDDDPAEHLAEQADRFQSGGGDVGKERHVHNVRGPRLRAPDDRLAVTALC
jgi:hypothetical protein